MGRQDQCFYDSIVPSLLPGDEWVESVVMEISHRSLPWLACRAITIPVCGCTWLRKLIIINYNCTFPLTVTSTRRGKRI